jgi:uncharacterized protein YhfF
MKVDSTVQVYWDDFLRRHPEQTEAVSAEFQAWAFGNSPEMADDLGNLVAQGVKTATASLVWSYEAGLEAMPAEGTYSIILDGRGQPMCVIRTTRLYAVPFDEVDAEQAYLEGEGDRSLAYWRKVHWEFFGQGCREIGREPDPKMPVLCERFVLLHR